MNPRPSPSPKHGKMPIRVTALSFDLCMFSVLSQPMYHKAPSPVKTRERWVTASLRKSSQCLEFVYCTLGICLWYEEVHSREFMWGGGGEGRGMAMMNMMDAIHPRPV
jgi:hypothetical protein